MVSQRCRMAKPSSRPKARMKRPGSAVPCAFMCDGRTDEPDHRREDDGDEPGGDERNRNHGKQRERILSGVVVGEADRQEAEDRDQRSRQHGEGGGGIGEGCRLDLFHAFLDLRDHHLDGDHGVVDEKPEGDDERAEGNALQADAHRLPWPTKTMARTSGMDRATTSPALRPRLRKLTASTMTIASKSALVNPPMASRTTSGWSDTRLSSMPTGKRCIRRSAASCRPSPKVEIVAALAHVDADADRRLAVDAEHLGGRVAVAALHLGDVGQFVEAPVDPEVEVGDVLRRQERAGDVDKHVLTAAC